MNMNFRMGPWRVPVSLQALSGLAGYVVLNLAASFCFKECGTDAQRTWFYFAAGNVFGPLSLIFLMRLYAGMNANLAAALSMGVSAISVQVAFWLVYEVRLMPWQWAGIALAITGGLLAVSGRPRSQAPAVPGPVWRGGAAP